MKHYCLGFVFDADQSHVLLLKKRSTDRFNANRWNGVGGHIEAGERPEEAMSRECAEEVGLAISDANWVDIGGWGDDETFRIELFAALGALEAAKQLTDEEFQIFDRKQAASLDFANDVADILSSWLDGHTVF